MDLLTKLYKLYLSLKYKHIFALCLIKWVYLTLFVSQLVDGGRGNNIQHMTASLIFWSLNNLGSIHKIVV